MAERDTRRKTLFVGYGKAREERERCKRKERRRKMKKAEKKTEDGQYGLSKYNPVGEKVRTEKGKTMEMKEEESRRKRK